MWWGWELMDSLVVQDLVPDMTLFYKQYKSIQPWLQADKPPTDGSELLPPSKRFGIGILTGSVRTSSRGALPVQGGPRQARRHVRVHPLRVLLHQLPFVSSSSPLPISFLLSPNPHRSSTQLLVEPGHLPRPRFVPSILTPSPGSKLTRSANHLVPSCPRESFAHASTTSSPNSSRLVALESLTPLLLPTRPDASVPLARRLP